MFIEFIHSIFGTLLLMALTVSLILLMLPSYVKLCAEKFIARFRKDKHHFLKKGTLSLSELALKSAYLVDESRRSGEVNGELVDLYLVRVNFALDDLKYDLFSEMYRSMLETAREELLKLKKT